MMVIYQGNAIAALTSQNGLPLHLTVCGGKFGKYGGSFDRKRRQKRGYHGKGKSAVQSAIGQKRI